MRMAVALACFGALCACGGQVASDKTAAVARENAAARDAAQEARIPNPEALACIRASSTEEEWAIIATETGEAPRVLAEVLDRESTDRCFRENRVVIYI